MTFKKIGYFPKETDIIAWPNIENRWEILKKWVRDRYRFIYPSNRIKEIWDKYWYHKKWIVRPVGIDTQKYKPCNKAKDKALIYFKTRFKEELEFCKSILFNKRIKYTIINYDIGYDESTFLKELDTSKYVIWIGQRETQWIALEETLSKDIPILLWDIKKMWDWDPKTNFQKKYYAQIPENWEPATSAEYFDESCWIRFYKRTELEKNIDYMEKYRDSKFSPRKYIENNLSLEKQAKEMCLFYKDIDRWNNIKYKKYFRSNLLLKCWRYLLDNKLLSHAYKIIIKLYQNITINKNIKYPRF